MSGQVPLMPEGDRTAPWLPQPAAPAEQQQLGTRAKATCSPMCLLCCWGHPGVPLAAGCGQSPGEQEEAAQNTLAKLKVP